MTRDKIKNMEDFAKASGISRPTISKFFNDPSSVRESLKSKIEAALERYDYYPNFYAINQNRQLTKNIGIVVPYVSDPFFAEIARNLERRCIDAGYTPFLFSSHGEQAQENTILDTLRSLKPAGVLMAPLGRASDRSKIEKFCKNVPTILFDSNVEGLGSAFIGSDNYSFISQTVEYLNSTGSAPSFFEMRYPANPNANKRREAYLKIMESLKLKPQVIKIEGTGWEFEEIGRQGALKLLRENGMNTNTILCSNDRLAIGFLSACSEMGVKVGKTKSCDLRVAGCDDNPYSRFTSPSLTTAAHDYHTVSDNAALALFELINNGGKSKKRTETLFSAKLVLRDSA
ncbi:MAG: LacI family DNA-binding transcriptional regulator [Bacteroidetes bacterium]|nr:LacI family DNA-binding transcriptional regulator [Bacteroidota bacterium]